MTTPTHTITVDYENNADQWWTMAQAYARVYPLSPIAKVVNGGDSIELTADEHALFMRQAPTMPGWDDGPAHAPHPVVFA